MSVWQLRINVFAFTTHKQCFRCYRRVLFCFPKSSRVIWASPKFATFRTCEGETHTVRSALPCSGTLPTRIGHWRPSTVPYACRPRESAAHTASAARALFRSRRSGGAVVCVLVGPGTRPAWYAGCGPPRSTGPLRKCSGLPSATPLLSVSEALSLVRLFGVRRHFDSLLFRRIDCCGKCEEGAALCILSPSVLGFRPSSAFGVYAMLWRVPEYLVTRPRHCEATDIPAADRTEHPPCNVARIHRVYFHAC